MDIGANLGADVGANGQNPNMVRISNIGANLGAIGANNRQKSLALTNRAPFVPIHAPKIV